ncbi:unnamed protein product, partial [Allacma fusca]
LFCKEFSSVDALSNKPRAGALL